MAFALARHDAVRLFAQGGILMTGSLILSWHRGFISTGLLLLGVLVASRVSVTRTVIAFAVGLVVVGVGYLIAIELVPEIFGKILELKGSKGLKTERFEIWLGYLPIVLTHPFGVGITAASVLRTAAQYGMPHVPHNVYLNLALQIGFLGFAAFFMLVGPIVLRNARAWHLARDPRLRKRGAFLRSRSPHSFWWASRSRSATTGTRSTICSGWRCGVSLCPACGCSRMFALAKRRSEPPI